MFVPQIAYRHNYLSTILADIMPPNKKASVSSTSKHKRRICDDGNKKYLAGLPFSVEQSTIVTTGGKCACLLFVIMLLTPLHHFTGGRMMAALRSEKQPKQPNNQHDDIESDDEEDEEDEDEPVEFASDEENDLDNAVEQFIATSLRKTEIVTPRSEHKKPEGMIPDKQASYGFNSQTRPLTNKGTLLKHTVWLTVCCDSLIIFLDLVEVGEDYQPKALSFRQAKTQSKRDIVYRIHAFVNQFLFKKLKFATNENMVKEAIRAAMVEFQVHEENFSVFYNIYRATMMDSINTKRGTCAQTGSNIVLGKIICDAFAS